MHQKHGEREQRYGGRRLSCGGWNGGFGAVRDTAIVAGSDVVVYDRHVGVVGENKLCRDAGGVVRSLKQGHGNENKRLDNGQPRVDIKRYVTFYFTNFPVHLWRFYLRNVEASLCDQDVDRPFQKLTTLLTSWLRISRMGWQKQQGPLYTR
jgi:hypothetical protein